MTSLLTCRTPLAGCALSGVLLFLLCRSATAQYDNFTCDDPALVAAAEQARVASALFWSGRALPGRWSRPCPITVQPAEHSGGGSTSFQFDRGEVSGWRMTIAGQREALLADVVPHEVDHMVRASLVRRPVPRWLDEGCATLMESSTSHALYRQRVARHLEVRVDAAFVDRMDYPDDGAEFDRLYAVGFSLVEFLLSRRDAATLLAFQADERPPSQKLTAYYGLTVAGLEQAWRPWAAERARAGYDCQTVCCPRHGGSALQAGPSPRPQLTVYTSRWCAPCQRFWQDYRTNARLRTALEQRFLITAIDVDQRPELARSRRIDAVPAFESPTQRVYGYEGADWLLSQLGLDPAAAPPVPAAPVPAAPVPAAPVPAAPVPAAAVPPAPAPVADEPQASTTDNAPGLFTSVTGALVRTVIGLSPWGPVLGVLGGTAATGGLGAIALAAGVALWRRRQRRRQQMTLASHVTSDARAAGGGASRPAPFPRALDEARELLELRQSEGRVAVLDALRGMVLDDELQKAAADAGPAETAALNRLRAAVDARVNEIAPLSVRLEQ